MTEAETARRRGNIKAPRALKPAPADPWIARFADLIPPGGPVLDLAAGGGRNGRFFLARGRAAVFIDRSTDALADLAETPGAEIVKADLEAGPPVSGPAGALSGRVFAGVVCVNYLHRPLLAALPGLLAPGGALLYSTFMAGNEKFGRPSNPDYLLRPGELRAYAEAQGLDTAAFEEGPVTREDGAQAVRQSVAAVRRRG